MLEPEPDVWQDPCHTQVVSISRLVVLVALFLTMCSSAILLALLEDRPYGIQFSTLVGYTAAVAFYTFSQNRGGNQSFLLCCPAVRGELGRLIRRHLGFITAIFIAQTTALRLRASLPKSWITPSGKDPSLFAILLGLLCLVIALVQILTNRSLLDRAHNSAQSMAAG